MRAWPAALRRAQGSGGAAAAAGRPLPARCRRHLCAPARRLFSTVEAVSVTAADDAVTVTLESGGASYSATVECGKAASGRGAAEAETAGPILTQVLKGMEATDQQGIDGELVRLRFARPRSVFSPCPAAITRRSRSRRPFRFD